jgi:hypothetical protein
MYNIYSSTFNFNCGISRKNYALTYVTQIYNPLLVGLLYLKKKEESGFSAPNRVIQFKKLIKRRVDYYTEPCTIKIGKYQ